MTLTKYSALELASELEAGNCSSVEATSEYLAKIDEHTSLNAFITTTPELALAAAKASDERRAAGQTLSIFDGVPLAVKDNFLTKGITTTNASRFYEKFVPPYESTITHKLNVAGLVTLGKTNMDEFAMGSDNTTSYFGPVINPWRGDSEGNKVPGGSSGGSAVAVAAGLAPLALGTDTGGSIRQPAAFCGLVGMKPTYGTCSRRGIFSFASSLDQAGPMTRTVKDNAQLLTLMAGEDKGDSTMAEHPTKDFSALIGEGFKKVTIGIIKEYEKFPVSPEVMGKYEEALQNLRNLGATLKEVSFPYANDVLPIYYIIAPVEAASNFARYDGIRYGRRAEGDSLFEVYQNSRSEGFGAEVKSRILVGTYNVLQQNFHIYLQACKVRRLVAEEYRKIFDTVDLIATPTTTITAFGLDNSHDIPPLEMYYNDIFTVGANLAGIPALSMPIGLSTSSLPVGLQLCGSYYSEAQLYQVAHALEEVSDFKHLG